MNDGEVERQIDQMVRFIKQEAEEKANEINVSAEEEFNIQKLQQLDAEKAKIRKEYEKKESSGDAKKKIERSKQLNNTRIKVLQAREDAVQHVVKESQAKLADISKDPKRYKTLLIDLIVQALGKLAENDVLIKTRKVDQGIVKEVLEEAKKKYKDIFGQDSPTIKLNEKEFLPPPPSSAENVDEEDNCCGGVAVTSADGNIVCSNTLDDRLRIAYSQNLPTIRATLFGIEAPVRA